MGKLSNTKRELERRGRRCKHVRIKDSEGACNLNSAHRVRGKKHEHMSLCQILEDENEETMESNNELTHKANQNCASPSSGKEEQKLSLFEGGGLKGVFLLRLANREEDGLENINVRLKRHNMMLNGAACYDGTS